MSLEKTILPGFVLAQLFASSLVEQPVAGKEKGTEEKEPSALPISYLGKNLHRLTIGVHFAGHKFLPADSHSFLTSVLKACQRNIEDVAVINFATCNPALEEIAAQMNPLIVMLFGSYPLYGHLMAEQPDFAATEAQSIRIIRLPGFDRLIENSADGRNLKGRLWLLLKELFSL